MNTRELIQKAKERRHTVESITAQRKRVLDADAIFEKEAEERRPTIKFLNRIYNLETENGD